ncbi:MAG: MBL fold metallo-hydrolase [Phycisphaerae bacterium]
MTIDRSERTAIDLGGCRVSLIDGGALKLDGGAMFGIIPKPLWQRKAAPDEQNRIQLACNCLLVEWERQTTRRVLVESGTGGKYADKEQQIFEIDPDRTVEAGLRKRDIDPATITDVVMTHLHFDHAGGLTTGTEGEFRPTFPNARVHVQRAEFDDAKQNFGIMHATYRDENFAPLDASDAWQFCKGRQNVLENIIALPSPGHTRGHQSILIKGNDRSLLFIGDVMPTAAHVGAPYNMAYDLFPLENRESKRNLLEMLTESDTLVVCGHEPHTPVLRVVRDKSWFLLQPVDS